MRTRLIGLGLLVMWSNEPLELTLQYESIFIDFARRVGLLSAVNAYFQSAADEAITFGGYRNWIAANPPATFAGTRSSSSNLGLIAS